MDLDHFSGFEASLQLASVAQLAELHRLHDSNVARSEPRSGEFISAARALISNLANVLEWKCGDLLQ